MGPSGFIKKNKTKHPPKFALHLILQVSRKIDLKRFLLLRGVYNLRCFIICSDVIWKSRTPNSTLIISSMWNEVIIRRMCILLYYSTLYEKSQVPLGVLGKHIALVKHLENLTRKQGLCFRTAGSLLFAMWAIVQLVQISDAYLLNKAC